MILISGLEKIINLQMKKSKKVAPLLVIYTCILERKVPLVRNTHTLCHKYHTNFIKFESEH